jgi:hypothetical protein
MPRHVAGLQYVHATCMTAGWTCAVPVAAEAAPTAPGFDRSAEDRPRRCGSGFSRDGNEGGAHAFAERQRPMPQALRPAIAVGVMLASVYAAAAVGLVDLIAKGYGALTWLFLAVYVLPLLTWGLWLLWRDRADG